MYEYGTLKPFEVFQEGEWRKRIMEGKSQTRIQNVYYLEIS
jgi:hypothetical protein